MSRINRRGRNPKTPDAQPILEELEPRLLFSADAASLLVADGFASRHAVTEIVLDGNLEPLAATEGVAALAEQRLELAFVAADLGNSTLSTANLARYQQQLQAWGQSLDAADPSTGQQPVLDDNLGPVNHAPTPASSANERLELVFVDTDTPEYGQLVDDLLAERSEGRRIEVILLDNTRDGVEQITTALQAYDGVDAIHIISHGRDGAIDMGGSELSAANLTDYQAQLQTWGTYLDADADILIYGCNLAASAAGEDLIQRIATLTGADIAASDDLTGAASLGGDWELEYHFGTIESALAFSTDARQTWAGVLDSVTVTTDTDVLSGDADTSSIAGLSSTPGSDGVISLREAIIAANNTVGIDTISFDIAGAGPHTINVGSTALGALPSISEGVVIDGWSEPDFAGTPVIELNGAAAGAGAHGLQVTGGTTTVQGLVINHFDGAGLFLTGGDGNIIRGNYIGTNAAGTSIAANNGQGIYLDATSGNNTIGGPNAADANLISGNNASNTAVSAGIYVLSKGNTIQGNLIGTDISGTISLANDGAGIALTDGTSDNLIGGTGSSAGNIIGFNSGDGVRLFTAAGGGNSILGNQIFSNAGDGIDLKNNGVTANDAADPDAGPNELQNFAVLTSAGTDGSKVAVAGSLNTTADTTVRLEFFITDAAAAGNGEGKIWLGATTVITDSSGNAQFATAFDQAVAAGEYITSTATVLATGGIYGSTSEFSANIQATSALIVDTFDDVVDGTTTSVAALLAARGADGKISLREAIIATNNTTGADMISLAAGTYSLTITGQGENGAMTGDLDISDDLTIVGAGAGATIIDGGGNGATAGTTDRVFEVSGATVAISDVTIQGGDVLNHGGGLRLNFSSDVTLSRVVMANNLGSLGGAIRNDKGILTLTDVTLDNNTATSDGGAINNDGALRLVGVTISNNTGDSNGGGVWTSGASSNFTAINTTFSGNTTPGDGGALYNAKNAILEYVTITNNTAASGSGIREVGAASTSIGKSIIAGNSGGADLSGSYVSLGNNLIGNKGSASGFTDGVNGDQVGDATTPIDPLLDILADNGGNTQTHALLIGSGGINTGATAGAPAIDQRGYFRDDITDIGAYEYNGTDPAANSAPVITSDGGGDTAAVNVAENSTAVTTVTASDADGDIPTFTITGGVDKDFFSLVSATGALSFAAPPDYENALDSGANNTYVVEVTASDGNGGSDVQAITVSVTDVSNTAPVVATSVGTLSYTEQTTATVIDTGITITDPDGQEGASFSASFVAEVRVNANYDGNDILGFSDTANIQGSLVGNTLTLTVVSGQTASVAEFQAALRSVTFYNGSDNPGTADREITFWFDDGTAVSNIATKTVAVQNENDAPVVTTSAGPIGYVEQATAIAIDNGLTLTDPDGFEGVLSSDQFVGVVNISGNFANGDTLGFTDTAKIQGQFTGSELVLSVISGQTATVADFEAALQAVTFYNGTDNPSALDRTISFAFDDAIDSSNVATRVVQFTAVNDNPIVTLPGMPPTYAAGGSPIIIDASATVSDVDSANFDTGYLRIGFSGGTGTPDDVLKIRNQGTAAGEIGVSGSSVTYGGVTIGTVTGGTGGANLNIDLNTSATPAAVQTLARNIEYENVSATPDTTPRSIRFELVDGDGGNSPNVFQTVNIAGNPNNDPTLDTAIADQSATEDVAFSFAFAANTFGDADGDALTYTAQLSGGGALPGWLTFNAGTRSFSGTPLNGDVGSVSVDVMADDGMGGTPATDSFDIVVSNANDDPTLDTAIADQSATEDVAFSFAFAANTFGDADGDALTYTAQLSGGGALPGWLTFNAGTRTFSGTPLNGDVGSVSVDVMADDGMGGTPATDTFDIVVSNANDDPTLDTAIADQSATEDVAFSFAFAANTFGDADGDALTYTAQLSGGGALPGWLTFNAGTRTFSGTPLNGDVGSVSVDVMADDGMGGTPATDSFDIVVSNANDDPTLDTAIADQSATEDVAFSFAFAANTFGDADGDALTYTAQLSGGGALPGWLTFNAGTRSFSGTPLNGDVGSVSVDVMADDGMGGTPATDTFDIVVSNANDDPTLDNAIADQMAAQDAAFNFSFAANTFNDVDATDTLTYTATLSDDTALPAWLDFDGATRSFSGTPANANVGTLSIKVTADDGSSTVTDQFDLVINNVADPPVIGGVDTGAVTEDVDPDTDGLLEVAAALTISDPDVGESSFVAESLTGSYGSLTIDAAGNWDYSADNTQAAIQQLDELQSIADVVTVTTADGTAHDITITINGAEDAPTLANAMADQMATQDAAFNFAFAANTFNDVDATDTLTYTATLSDDTALPAWLSFNGATRSFSGTPANADVGTLSIKVTADDGSSTVTDQFDLVINNVADPPVIGGVDTGAVTEDVDPDTDGLLEVAAALTISDPDVGESSFVAETLTGTYGDLTIDTAGNWNYAADNTQSAIQQLDTTESLSDQFVVTTADGTKHTITLTIDGAEDAPVLVSPLGDQSATEDTPYSFMFGAGTFDDADASDSLSYNASLADGSALPSWLIFTDATRTFSGTPANADVGEITIKLTASDGTSSVSDEFTLTVANAADAPVIGGTDTGTVTEDVDPDTDGLLETAAALTISDPDVGESSFIAETLTGIYGDLAIDSAGNWTFEADNTQTTIQALDSGESLTDDFTVTTADGTKHTIRITIDGAEDAPTLATAISDQNATEDSPYSFTFAASTFEDVDASDTLVYTATLADDSALPSWLIFTEGTRTFSGTPANADVGEITVKLTATDGTSSVSDEFTLTVANTADAPVIGGTDTGTVTEDVDPDTDGLLEVAAALTISDPDVGESSFVAETLTGTYGDLTIDTAGNWSYAADNTQVAIQQLDTAESLSDQFVVTTADGTKHTIQITIEGAEDAPTLASPVGDQSATEDTLYSFTFAANTFEDVDASDSLSYTATLAGGSALPSWLTFTEATRTFSGTPTNADVGQITIKLTAGDGTGSVSDEFTLTVLNAADAPVIGGTDTGTVTEDVDPDGDGLLEFAAALTISDPDGNESSFAAETLTGTVGKLVISSTGDWVYTADNSQLAIQRLDAGESLTETFRVTTADGSQHPVTVTIAGANDRPVLASPIADQTVGENSHYSFRFPANTFSDIDASDTLSYSASQANGAPLPSWLMFDNTSRTFSGTPTKAHLGSLTIEVKGSDGTSSASDSFTLTVTSASEAPVIGGVDTGTITEDVAPDSAGRLNVANALTISDPNAGESNFVAASHAGKYGQLQIDSSGNWSYSASNKQLKIQQLDSGESLSDALTVSTADGSKHTITITIRGAEDKPILAQSLADQSAMAGSPFRFTLPPGTFSDVDASDTLTYHATLEDGAALPQWLAFDPSTRTFSGTPGTEDVSPISVRVTAGDGNSSVSDVFTLEISTSDESSNHPPTGSVSVLGQPVEGERLKADTSTIHDADGLGEFSYQWLRDGEFIAGATADDYTLAAVDVGTRISVQVSYRDNQGTAEAPLTSDRTAIVSAVEPPVIEPPESLPPQGPPTDRPVDPETEKEPENEPGNEPEMTATPESRAQPEAVKKSEAEMTTLAKEGNSTGVATKPAADVELQKSRLPGSTRIHYVAPATKPQYAASNDARPAVEITPIQELEYAQPVGLATNPTSPGQVQLAGQRAVQALELIESEAELVHMDSVLNNHAMWQAIDTMSRQMEDSEKASTSKAELLVVQVAGNASIGLVAGVVAYALRGGALLSSLLSTLPLWSVYDPLPILNMSRPKANKAGKAGASTAEENANDDVESLFGEQAMPKNKSTQST